MNASLRRRVWNRAKGICEYCRLPQEYSSLPHEVDHIRAQKHSGKTDYQNTCLACANCNGAKGPNVAGFDPLTDELVPLFNPRIDKWSDHFDWNGPVLSGLTPIGRVTIAVLRINDLDRVNHRQLLVAAGIRCFGKN